MRKITFLLTLLLMYAGVTPMMAELVDMELDESKVYTIKFTNVSGNTHYLYSTNTIVTFSSSSAFNPNDIAESFLFRFKKAPDTSTSSTQTSHKAYYIQSVLNEKYVTNRGESQVILSEVSGDLSSNRNIRWVVQKDGDIHKIYLAQYTSGSYFLTNCGWYPQNSESPVDLNSFSSRDLKIEEVFINDEELNAKKAELNNKIQQAENLLSTSGFSFVPGEKVALQVNNSSTAGYLSSNADHNALNSTQTDGRGIGALIDGQINDPYYFHTSWGNNKPSAYHYIQVDLGDANKVSEFLFNYTTRNGTQQGTSPAPTQIEVYAGNSTDDLKLIQTISSGLPSYWPAAQTYQSDVISAGESYRYLRFQVTGSAGPGSNGYTVGSTKYFFFCMAEFGISLPEQVVVTNDSYLGKEQQLKELNQEVKDAKAVVEENNLQSIEDAITELTTLLNAISPLASINVTLAQISDTDNLLYGLKGYIGSFSAPYATLIPEGVEAYYATSKDNMGYITLTPCKATATSAKGVPANFGVILVSESKDVTMNPASGHIDTPANNVFGNSAGKEVEIGAGDYILASGKQGIGFYESNPGTLAKNKAFLRLGTSQTSALRLVLDETVTGINGVATEKVDAPVYDLSGRRVLNTVKGGIYIQNGKKFIVK